MAKSKVVPTKADRAIDCPMKSVKGLTTTVNADHGDHSEHDLRRSKRLKGISISASNPEASAFNPGLPAKLQAKPNKIKLSAPALPSTKAVRNRAIVPSNNGSTFVGATDHQKSLGKHTSRQDEHSSSPDPNVPINNIPEKPDIDNFSEYNQTDHEENDDSDAEQDDDDQSIESFQAKQDHSGGPSVRPRKRKAETFGGKKAADPGSRLPAKKKQKVDKPVATRAPKRERKAGNSKPKTAKARFLAASAEDKRPLPWGEPEVWAETRPELCEALPWYHCWQGAGHTHNGFVLGMLLDEDQGERAYMDEHIAITRAGGGIGKNTKGEYRQVKDQDSENGRIKAFINNEKDKIPMHLIIGQHNIHCPSKIPHRYCVTPEFHITDHWEERSNGHVVVKFRFEKVDLDSKSWFAAEDSPEVYVPTEVKALRKECPKCKTTKPQVFKAGWMCLHSKCELFWIRDGIVEPETQEYNTAFLEERSVYDGFLPPYAMEPELIELNATHGQAFPVTKQCWEGIVCKLCGRCNLRSHWDAWRCRTEGCPFEHRLSRDVIAASSVMGDGVYGYQGHAVCEDKVFEPSTNREIRKCGLFRETLCQLGEGLTIAHLSSNNIINAAPGGADDLFCEMQTGDFGLERLPMKTSVVDNTYSRHFSHNFGMPYNYVVGHDNSTKLSEAPEAIKEALRRMTWAAKRILSDEQFVAFNELLAIGYLESMMMNYHDDGEASLGPTVASLSLGCPAKMRWRLKMRYWSGFKDKKQKKYDPQLPILPGCRKPEERRKLNELAKTLSASELDVVAQKLLSFAPRESKTPPVVLEMDLRHGDYMVMHGGLMQVYYEHAVTPTDKLRFGLTCRFVKPEMVPEDMRTMGDLTLDPAKAYDGDLELYKSHMEKYKASKVTKKRVTSGAAQA